MEKIRSISIMYNHYLIQLQLWKENLAIYNKGQQGLANSMLT